MASFIFLTLSFLGLHLSGIANEIISKFENQQQQELFCAMQIYEQQPDAIQTADEDKLYLNPDRIKITANGLFLCGETSQIFLPVIHSADEGCYLNVPSRTDFWRTYYKCSNSKCNYKFVGGPAWNNKEHCPKCNCAAYRIIK